MTLYRVFFAVWALWVAYDGFSRGAGTAAFLWAIGTFLFGPIVLPIYLAKRPLKNGELREGGTAWNVLKNFAILWSACMAIVLIRSLMAVEKLMPSLTSAAQRAGWAIGTMEGLGLIAALWFVPTAGAVVLGLSMKDTSIIEKRPDTYL